MLCFSPLSAPKRRPVNREERPPPRRASSRSTMLPYVLHCMDVSFALPSFSYNTTIQRTKLLFFFHLCKNFAQILLKIFIFSRFHGIAGCFSATFHPKTSHHSPQTSHLSPFFSLALSPNADFGAFTCGADTILGCLIGDTMSYLAPLEIIVALAAKNDYCKICK